MSSSELIAAVVYPKQRKVACVLLQAAYGGSSRVAQLFDSDLWVTFPEHGARMMRGTREEWQRVAKEWNNVHKEPT